MECLVRSLCRSGIGELIVAVGGRDIVADVRDVSHDLGMGRVPGMSGMWTLS